MTDENTHALLVVHDLHKRFKRASGETVKALDGVSFCVERGSLTVLVGPDGSGKTTLIRLAAGLMAPDTGGIKIGGLNAVADPQAVQDRIGYMPQHFGLYEDLSVEENLDLYADLSGIPSTERPAHYAPLMEMTGLGPFKVRLARRLSGGMKQKLGLACTLLRTPDLLLLDEPTVGVDPLSRRELWAIVRQLVREQGHTVFVSTAYFDEAEHADYVVVLHQGKILAKGPPADITSKAAGRTYSVEPFGGETACDLQARLLSDPQVIDAVPEAGRVRLVSGCDPHMLAALSRTAVVAIKPVPPRFEDGFMALLDKTQPRERISGMAIERPAFARGDEVAVEVHELVRTFGNFTAVDHVSFAVKRGEIFGLLGPNGAGKTTTFSMLCGLLPASGGTLKVAGADLRTARASARQHIGYMAQKFSLYGQLSVRENLDFFARAYGLRGRRKTQRTDWAIQQFDLGRFARLAAQQLPGGYKQRLAMAAALLHEPEILFLDEATSGADPIARRAFWGRINALATAGVTVIITTHFMEEAEYCDRVLILDAGKLLAQGTPTELRAHAQGIGKREPSMEDAFVTIVERAREHAAPHAAGAAA